MQPSILFRLVLVLLAMSVAKVLACVPERAGGEESSAAVSQPGLSGGQTSEKLPANIVLEARNRGGPAALALLSAEAASNATLRPTCVATLVAEELRDAGVPTCGFTGLLTDLADTHEHGRDERVSVQAFHEGHESLFQVVKLLFAAASAPAQR